MKKKKLIILLSVIIVIAAMGLFIYFNINIETPTNPIVMANKYDAEIIMYASDSGGRKYPIYDGYNPKIDFSSTSVIGVINFDQESISPGETANAVVTLESSIDLQVGMEFFIIEGTIEVGKGTVKNIYNNK